MRISVVVPVYGCDSCLVELHRQLSLTLDGAGLSFELLLVCDGSPDKSWQVIKELATKDARVRGIALSRNFGQHVAITAGCDAAQGDYVVVMDCDLQHPPGEIPKLYAKAQEGFDVVFGRRAIRQDSWFKRTTSRAFVRILAFLVDRKLDPAVSNFSIVSHKVIASLRGMRERDRSYPYLISWLGFDTALIDVEHAERHSGETTYSLGKLLRFAISSVVSSSDKPLRLSIEFGLMVAVASSLWGAWLILRYFAFDRPPDGWTSVMVSIFFVAGLLFANLGVLGLYVGRIFEETKGRPLYAVKDRLNASEDQARAPQATS